MPAAGGRFRGADAADAVRPAQGVRGRPATDPGDQQDVLELQYRLFGNIPDNEDEGIVKILEPELKLEIAKDEDTQTLSIAEETIEEMVNPIAELEEPVPTEKPIPTEKKASKGEIEVLEESEALAALDGLEWG